MIRITLVINALLVRTTRTWFPSVLQTGTAPATYLSMKKRLCSSISLATGPVGK